MERFREGLRAFQETLLDLWARATNGSVVRQRLFAIVGALLLLAIAGGLVLAAMAPDPAPQQVAQRGQPTATLAATSTLTATVKPTAKPTIKPTVRPKPKTPPPPPPPIPPTPTPGGSNPTTNFCPTPTPLPAPTATNTPIPTATATVTPIPSASSSPGGTSTSVGSYVGLILPAACQTCPYYAGNNPSQSQIASALASAAQKYGLPINLLKAVAWQESRWHEDVTSCDGGIGLMQIQYYTYPWLNQQAVPECGLTQTSDDPYKLQGNANLGAKYLKYLACYWSYWGGFSGDGNSLNNPYPGTSAWFYLNATPPLRYPDTLNADGSTNTSSVCAAVYNDPTQPEFAALPENVKTDVWNCPYGAYAGDFTLLDLVLSSYNEGPGNTGRDINSSGKHLSNQWYVSGVEGYIPQFASGALP